MRHLRMIHIYFWRIRPTTMCPTFCSSGRRTISRRCRCNNCTCSTTTRVSLSTHTDAPTPTLSYTQTHSCSNVHSRFLKQIWVKLAATLTKFGSHVGSITCPVKYTVDFQVAVCHNWQQRQCYCYAVRGMKKTGYANMARISHNMPTLYKFSLLPAQPAKVNQAIRKTL
ncbi:hypothetical protein M5D96_005744 [Drosophila gunungcola]|uniref:Uncharacterized protein n=1 Tax=Drosophila gunungcola TaxID=103775 RepID=A0A9Q0BRU5_9MUSC|nr:hypothetical protein M5D96_005744 [Drosophila gunungcola]